MMFPLGLKQLTDFTNIIVQTPHIPMMMPGTVKEIKLSDFQEVVINCEVDKAV